MSERRRLPRNRVYYGGTVAFNDRNSTLACVVRDFSVSGAKIEFEDPTLIPDEVDFIVARKGLSCRARMIWRDRYAAGLMFSDLPEAKAVIPLE
jgi:PilZ domain